MSVTVAKTAGFCFGVRRAVQLAAETDLAMKSTGRDAEELLTELMLRLANG